MTFDLCQTILWETEKKKPTELETNGKTAQGKINRVGEKSEKD